MASRETFPKHPSPEPMVVGRSSVPFWNLKVYFQVPMGVNPWILGSLMKKMELIEGTPEADGLKSIGITVFFVQAYWG